LSTSQQKTKAEFVTIKEPKIEKFKYKLAYKLPQGFRKLLNRNKDTFIKSYQRVALVVSKFDWKVIKEDVSTWFLEALLEGVTANFATHFLFNVPLNPFTILAHGIIIKQGINIYWRLRNNGSHELIPKKDN